MEQIALPFEPWDKILAFAKYKGVNYLVADQKVIGNRNNIKFLFDDIFVSNDLRRVREFKDTEGNRIYIYQIVY